MNITMGLSVLLLGGWVLQSPTDDGNQPPAGPSYQTPAPTATPSGVGRGAAQPSTRNMNEGSYRRMLEKERGARYNPNNRELAPTRAKEGSGGMPSSPTNMDSKGLPLPPTADPNAPRPAAPQPADGGMQMPMPPTGRNAAPAMSHPMPGASRGSSYRSGRNPSFSGSATRRDQKAFASFNPYSSGVSPYMNLFRSDTDAGTIDNYTTLVRPALEQQAANQRFNMDIYGLERRARIQQHSLQQMQQQERTLQSVATPQYYMNYGGYYNSASGRR